MKPSRRSFLRNSTAVLGGMTLQGRSHYWGQIWVALGTRQIEYATLYEDVLGEMKLTGQETPQIIDVFRSAVLEPVARR